MIQWRLVAALLACLLLFAPGPAEARGGAHFHFGSGTSYMNQGSRGYAGPVQRSPSSPGSNSAVAPGYSNYHPFLTGLFGGFFGGMLGAMLFHGMGSIWIWLILIWLGWMGYRAMAGHFSPQTSPGGMRLGALGAMPMARPPAPAALAVSGADYQAFKSILKSVQAAWSSEDVEALRRSMTPEMLTAFSAELANNRNQGVINRVEQVELLQGDLREAWDEGQAHYATCLLRWRALDYMIRVGARPSDPGAIVEGDTLHPSEAAEIWTFMRNPGGQWRLSAIQQV